MAKNHKLTDAYFNPSRGTDASLKQAFREAAKKKAAPMALPLQNHVVFSRT